MSEAKSHTPIQRHIFICSTPTKPKCHSGTLGAECWDYLKKRLRELGHGDPRNGIHRTKADCLRVCEAGPTVVVYPEETWYHSMTVERLDRIITEHSIGGKVVEEYVITHPFKSIDAQWNAVDYLPWPIDRGLTAN